MLDKLDMVLAEERADYYKLLLPGVSTKELSAFETRFSLLLPVEFRNLYLWSGGQDPMSSLPIQGNRTFMTLKEIESTKLELDSMVGTDFGDEKHWRKSWIPFLHNGGGSYLCLDVAAVDGGVVNQLIGFWKADNDRPIEYSGVVAWLSHLISSMENGFLEIY